MTQHHRDIIEWRCCRFRLQVATCSSHCSMRTAAATLAVDDRIDRSRPLHCRTHRRNPDQYSSLPCQQFSTTQHHLDIIEWRCCRFRLQVATCSSHRCMQPAVAMMAVDDRIDRSRLSNCRTSQCNPAMCSFPCQQSSSTQHHLDIIEQRHCRLRLPVATCTNHCSM